MKVSGECELKRKRIFHSAVKFCWNVYRDGICQRLNGWSSRRTDWSSAITLISLSLSLSLPMIHPISSCLSLVPIFERLCLHHFCFYSLHILYLKNYWLERFTSSPVKGRRTFFNIQRKRHSWSSNPLLKILLSRILDLALWFSSKEVIMSTSMNSC